MLGGFGKFGENWENVGKINEKKRKSWEIVEMACLENVLGVL